MIFVSRPLRIGKSETYGIYYPRETLEAMVFEWECNGKPPIYGLLGQSIETIHQGIIDVECVATHIVGMSVDDEGLVVQQEILEVAKGYELQNYLHIMDDEPTLIGMKISPYMTGTQKKRHDGDYDIIYMKIRAFLFEVTV